MYPTNRDVEVGERLQVVLSDDNVHVLQIQRIEKEENNIYYYLAYS